MQAFRSRVKDQAEADDILFCCEVLSKPVVEDHLIARVVQFIGSHYYVPDAGDGLAKGMINDWIEELQGFPEWALSDAFKWWISSENPKRSKKPVPGDISDRAHSQMAFVRVARIAAQKYTSAPSGTPTPPEPEELSDEAAAARREEIDGVINHLSKKLDKEQTKKKPKAVLSADRASFTMVIDSWRSILPIGKLDDQIAFYDRLASKREAMRASDAGYRQMADALRKLKKRLEDQNNA